MGDLTARIPCRPETRDMIAALVGEEDDLERYDDALLLLHAEHTGDTENA